MIPSSVRIFVCTTPTDMRGSFDRLAQAARERLGEEPESGAVFVFINRRANRIKALWFDRNGYCMLYKRGHQAVFPPPKSTERRRAVAKIDAQALAKLFAGVHQAPRIRLEWHSDLDA